MNICKFLSFLPPAVPNHSRVRMWNFASNAIGSFGMKKISVTRREACSDCSDDDGSPNASREEGLECPICWESFNIVENIPYVLWCGHTLCKNCVLGLQWALLKFPTQQIKFPFFISCPWCHLLSFRLIYKGNLKYPRKNFFLLWMVESLNGDRRKSAASSMDGNNLPIWSPRSKLAHGYQSSSTTLRRAAHSSAAREIRSGDQGSSNIERHQFCLHKSLDRFIHLTTKFPLAIVFLLIIFFAIPGSVVILILYLLITILFAIPSLLVLYFAYPTLGKLLREITS